MGPLFCSLCKLYFSGSSGWYRLMGLYCLMNFSLFITELNLTQNFPVFFFWLGNLSQMYRVICLNVIVFDLAANYSSISSWPQSESTRSWRTFRKTHPHPAVLVFFLFSHNFQIFILLCIFSSQLVACTCEVPHWPVIVQVFIFSQLEFLLCPCFWFMEVIWRECSHSLLA